MKRLIIFAFVVAVGWLGLGSGSKLCPLYYEYMSPIIGRCDACPGCTRNGIIKMGCEDYTGRCLHCRPGYTGYDCGTCEEGYHGIKGVICCSPEQYLHVKDQWTHKCIDCACNKHGVYNKSCDNGICKCKDGFYDEKCNKIDGCSCNPDGVDPNDMGCNPQGKCNCKKGFVGDFCGCGCDPAGSKGTKCNSKGECTCKEGAYGDKCQWDCGCNDVGAKGKGCNNQGECTCNEGFFGKQCKGDCGCNDVGSKGKGCNNQGECTCNEGFFGKQCRKACACNPNGVDPKNKGCNREGKCTCKEGVHGDKCDNVEEEDLGTASNKFLKAYIFTCNGNCRVIHLKITYTMGDADLIASDKEVKFYSGQTYIPGRTYCKTGGYGMTKICEPFNAITNKVYAYIKSTGHTPNLVFKHQIPNLIKTETKMLSS